MDERALPADQSIDSSDGKKTPDGPGAAQAPSLNDERIAKLALVYKYILVFGD
jgi:hypothetical protein